MRLKGTRIVGFQSFCDTGYVEFDDGINLIVGQNNAGKSAFLKALLPAIEDNRHRSDRRWREHLLPELEVHLSIEVSGPELYDAFLRYPSGQISFPTLPINGVSINEQFDSYLKQSSIIFNVKRNHANCFISDQYPSHGLFDANNGSPHAIICNMNNARLDISGIAESNGDNLPPILFTKWANEMFYFPAQRPAYGETSFSYAARLDAAALNLPNVLNTLRGERDTLYQRLVSHIREVFPTIGNMSVRSTPQGNLEILLWPTEKMDELQLSFPLKNSGTGVAQVIAILTAIMTSNNTVIIIDEINSFLHPAAVKSLLRIIQTEYSQHQYIISTHAPEVIGFSNARTVHLIKRNGYDSTIEKIDLSSIEMLREIAGNLGISMADVFAADRVIWVEGPTEELCFPYICKASGKQIPRGTVFTSVTAPGDLLSRGKRSRKVVYGIYERLSSAVATLPVSVAISFDTELLNHAEIEQMKSESKGLMHFLPRRHLECYALDARAIAEFISI